MTHIDLKASTLLLVGLLVMTKAYSQKASDDLHYEITAGTYLSTGKTLPFWMRANQYGEVPLESGIFTLQGQISRDYKPRTGENDKFSYGYGVRMVGNVGKTNQFLLPEAYVKVRYGAFELYGGRRKEMVGLADSTLSSGSFIWSGNALPIPKIEIAVRNYTPLVKSGLISAKGNFSHGWFGSSQEHAKDYYLHQKSLYVRIGKPDWRFKMHMGANHQAQWGGRPTEPYIYKLTGELVTKYGSNFRAYRAVLFGEPIKPDADPDLFGEGTFNESSNRAGNHLGTVDVALEYNSPKANILLYRQSIYEDGSLFYLSNIHDGLNGLALTFKNVDQGIKKVVVEYLHTINQGGGIGHGITVPELRGRDNYFNNEIYRDGWTYKGQTLGTPFIMPWPQLTGFEFKGNEKLLIGNNRVKAIIFGMQSKAWKLDLITRFSYSKNWGVYGYKINKAQTSIQQSIALPIGLYSIQTGLYYDRGSLLEKNFGLQLAVKRSF